jgi:LysM repeat protein
MDILSRGFSLGGVDSVSEGDLVLLSKPKSIRYVVKPLETIEDISKQYDISISEIIEFNNLKSTKLFIGQILWL